MRKYEKKKWIIFIYLKNNVKDVEQMEFLTNQIIDVFRGNSRYAVVLSDYVDKVEFVPKSTWAYILMKILRILHDLIKGKKYEIRRNKKIR
jgi:hypothetical protein